MKKSAEDPRELPRLNGELFLIAKQVSGFRRVFDALVVLKGSDFMNEDHQEMMVELMASPNNERILRL